MRPFIMSENLFPLKSGYVNRKSFNNKLDFFFFNLFSTIKPVSTFNHTNNNGMYTAFLGVLQFNKVQIC